MVSICPSLRVVSDGIWKTHDGFVKQIGNSVAVGVLNFMAETRFVRDCILTGLVCRSLNC